MATDIDETSTLLHKDLEREADTGDDTFLKSNVVWWDGDKDPAHPYNWSAWRTRSNCFLISAMTFLTALASSIIAPGVPQVMTEFENDNLQLAAFVVSVYILGFAAGPLIIAPLSEVYGRVVVYHTCNIGFTVFAIACAFAPDLNTLIAFRFFNGLFGSCPATIGGGSIADMIPQERRAGVMAAYSVGALFAPIVGPMAGGALASAMGWRSVFWLLTISGGVFSIIMTPVLQETYHSILLEQKVSQLRRESGNTQLRSKLDSGLSPSRYLLRSIIRPIKLLTLSPIVIITSLFIAITYGYMYLLFTSFTEVFQRYYGFTTKNVGLCFLGLGIGSFLGVAVFSAVSDKIIKQKSAQAEAQARSNGSTDEIATTNTTTSISEPSSGKGMKPEYRLLPLPFAVLFLALGLLSYGWTVELNLHWTIPISCTVLIGLGQLLLFLVLQMYLIDVFTVYAASAVAAITAVRSIAGALLPLFGLSMYGKLGIGWGNSLLAAVCLPMVLVSILLFRYGEMLRERFGVRNL